MENAQTLGGTRQSKPLGDEVSYPLTMDEFLLLDENLISDKLTNWESFLLSTFIATLISGIVIYLNGCFEITVKNSNGQSVKELNLTFIITLIIYGAISIGTLLAYISSKRNNKSNVSTVKRLTIKISTHLNEK